MTSRLIVLGSELSDGMSALLRGVVSGERWSSSGGFRELVLSGVSAALNYFPGVSLPSLDSANSTSEDSQPLLKPSSLEGQLDL